MNTRIKEKNIINLFFIKSLKIFLLNFKIKIRIKLIQTVRLTILESGKKKCIINDRKMKKKMPSKPISKKFTFIFFPENIILEKINPDENTINNMVIKDINISNIYLSLIFFYKKLCYL